MSREPSDCPAHRRQAGWLRILQKVCISHPSFQRVLTICLSGFFLKGPFHFLLDLSFMLSGWSCPLLSFGPRCLVTRSSQQYRAHAGLCCTTGRLERGLQLGLETHYFSQQDILMLQSRLSVLETTFPSWALNQRQMAAGCTRPRRPRHLSAPAGCPAPKGSVSGSWHCCHSDRDGTDTALMKSYAMQLDDPYEPKRVFYNALEKVAWNRA